MNVGEQGHIAYDALPHVFGDFVITLKVEFSGPPRSKELAVLLNTTHTDDGDASKGDLA